MKHGGFKKSKSKKRILVKNRDNKKPNYSQTEINRLRRAENQGISIKDRQAYDSLLLAIQDPNVKEIIIKK